MSLFLDCLVFFGSFPCCTLSGVENSIADDVWQISDTDRVPFWLLLLLLIILITELDYIYPHRCTNTLSGVCVCVRVCKVGSTYTAEYIADTHIAKIFRHALGIPAAFTFDSQAKRWKRSLVFTLRHQENLDVPNGHSYWTCKRKAAKIAFFVPPSILAYIYIIFYIYICIKINIYI